MQPVSGPRRPSGIARSLGKVSRAGAARQPRAAALLEAVLSRGCGYFRSFSDVIGRSSRLSISSRDIKLNGPGDQYQIGQSELGRLRSPKPPPPPSSYPSPLAPLQSTPGITRRRSGPGSAPELINPNTPSSVTESRGAGVSREWDRWGIGVVLKSCIQRCRCRSVM